METTLSTTTYHRPVLLQEVLRYLMVRSEGKYVDGTFGGGGHSAEILKGINGGTLFAFDQDPDAIANIPEHPRLQFIPQNFSNLKAELASRGVTEVDGIIADLGISSHQIDCAKRGFSYRFEDSRLDMRMNPNQDLDAVTLLNEYPEAEISRILMEYGELSNARRIASELIQFRKHNKIETVGQLLIALQDYTPKSHAFKFLSQVFQAIRIEVNDELTVLQNFLDQALEVLKPEGRLVMICYHSLEDRLVKHFFQTGNFDGFPVKDFYGNIQTPWELPFKKPIEPTTQEITENPRARSAKLRVAIKK